MTRINLLEGYLKGKSKTHDSLYQAFKRWTDPHTAERDREANRRVREKKPGYSRGADHKSAHKAKTEVIAAYGGRCRGCPETDPACLTIDHKFDDGASERGRLGSGPRFYKWLRRFGFPKDRYQLLCMNCQWKKRAYGQDFSTWPTPKT